jgi:pimeloyl-ACP methyl ester carboxylesterase
VTATVVLVHGAWHGAWCFDRVVPLVRASGVDVVAVDLPGHGADARPLADLAGDAAHVASVLDAVSDEPGDVVLVGHSYGGAVITQAGLHEAVRELAYLCAFPVDLGESCANAAPEDPAAHAIDHHGRPNLGHAMVPADDGSCTVTVDGARACFYNGVDEQWTRWALDRLGPHSLLALAESPSVVAWRSRPSTYVVCADDMAVHPDLQAILARRCTRSITWDAGHSPFLSQPELVADLLIERATGSPFVPAPPSL